MTDNSKRPVQTGREVPVGNKKSLDGGHAGANTPSTPAPTPPPSPIKPRPTSSILESHDNRGKTKD